MRVEDAWSIYLEQDKKCAISGKLIEFSGHPHDNEKTTAVLALIDSDIEFTYQNIQWLDKTINKMRGNMSNDEFIQIGNQITSYSSRVQKETYNRTYNRI